MKEEYKPKIIQVSFKTTDIEDKLLYNWVLEKVRDVGGNKSAYIKSLLRKKMKKELEEN